MSEWNGWIETLVEAAVMTCAFIAVYDGGRRLARNGLSRWPALMMAVGLALPVYEASISVSVPARVRAQAIAQSAMRAPEPPGGWEKMPGTPEQRTSLSANAAMINYMVSGRPGDYIDAGGRRVVYTPTLQELQAREGLVRDEKGAMDAGEQFFERGVALFASALVAMIVGLVAGAAQRRRARA